MKEAITMSAEEATKIKDLGLAVINNEASAVLELGKRIDNQFVQACSYMLGCKGRIVVTGMGKSGHIGNKIAATLASTGTPAFFVHPGEASHGDLGMITPTDVVIALSNSGETGEILTILPLIKRMDVPMIALTGNAKSNLAKMADIHLDISVAQEACPLNLAPTSSTTATLAMGDALAIALLEARGFTEEDFARSHPGGSLGRRLLLKVSDIMHKANAAPRVSIDAELKEGLMEMTRKGLGMTAIVDDKNILQGVYTDGDLRRTLDQGVDLHSAKLKDLMTINCKTAREDMLAAEALQIMDQNKINALPIVDENNCLIGAINMHDLLRAGVV